MVRFHRILNRHQMLYCVFWEAGLGGNSVFKISESV